MEKYDHTKTAQGIFIIIGKVIIGVVIAAIMAFIFGLVVMWLWNWLMPDIFGLPQITFWKAWGLILLSHILFKSFPHSNHHSHEKHWKKHFREKYCGEHDGENQPEKKNPSVEES